MSLDAFRGFVILAMLLVNNIGDSSTTGYFWKHADWPGMNWAEAWRTWFDSIHHAPPPSLSESLTAESEAIQHHLDSLDYAYVENGIYISGGVAGETSAVRMHAIQERVRMLKNPWLRIPLFTQCTLADYVMPSFMLIIGVAIPFSVTAAKRRGTPPETIWIRAVRRAALLVVLGWILCYFRDQFAASLYGKAPWEFSLGMDVLQLLGMGYLAARIIYELPTRWRLVVAAALLVYHWALLRFYPQTSAPAGAFMEYFNALEDIYDHWSFWKFVSFHIGPVSVSWRGLMSVPPAAATMVLGTLIGDWLRREEVLPSIRAKRLAIAGAVGMVLGFLWAFNLPFNKPVWTPSYLVYVSGFDAVCIALLYWLIDLRGWRRWYYPLIVFGTNALALYFLSIMFKVLLLNTPRIRGTRLIDILLTDLKSNLGNWAGGWAFTVFYIGFWWMVMDQFYRRKIFWKL